MQETNTCEHSSVGFLLAALDPQLGVTGGVVHSDDMFIGIFELCSKDTETFVL